MIIHFVSGILIIVELSIHICFVVHDIFHFLTNIKFLSNFLDLISLTSDRETAMASFVQYN